ncbi:V-set and immunoglobulin domain-containing protein 1-like isoform 2-T2 [Fundulus diaphanus]
MTRLYFQVFLCAFILEVAPKCKGAETLSAFKDEDVALSCLNFNITDSLNCHRIKLTKKHTDAGDTVVFAYPKKSQEGKHVKLEANKKGQTCVFLTNLQKSDEGTYGFEIWKGWDMINVTSISLKIKDCRTLKQETAKSGAPVRLSCSVDAEKAPSNVTWAKLKGSNTVPVDPQRARTQGALLTIASVSANDGGWYRCDYILGQSQRCSKINLQVKGHQEDVFTTATVPIPAFTNTQQVFSQVLQSNDKEGNETSSLVVGLVITSIITLAALTGVFFYKRYKTQRNHAGCIRESLDVYENANLSCSPDAANRVNSLYAYPDESVRTFQM